MGRSRCSSTMAGGGNEGQQEKTKRFPNRQEARINTTPDLDKRRRAKLSVIFFFWDGLLLPVHPFRLLGKYDPAVRHFFKCLLALHSAWLRPPSAGRCQLVKTYRANTRRRI